MQRSVRLRPARTKIKESKDDDLFRLGGLHGPWRRRRARRGQPQEPAADPPDKGRARQPVLQDEADQEHSLQVDRGVQRHGVCGAAVRQQEAGREGRGGGGDQLAHGRRGSSDDQRERPAGRGPHVHADEASSTQEAAPP